MTKEEFSVTPYEVTGQVDYDKLILQFGVKRIDTASLARLKKHTGDHFMLRRQHFFAHTNLDKVLDALDKKEKVYIYTGRAPSGPIHIGHLFVWTFTKWLQDRLNATLIFQIPDEEKVLFKDDLTFEDSAKWTRENLIDIIALGFDLKKTRFLIDTKHANVMYKLACQVAKKTTASTVRALFGLKNEDNVGKYFYTTMQSVPAFLPTVFEGKQTQCLIPCAVDQDVHFRLTRDVAEKLGYPKPATILSKFVPSLSRDSKMSSSGEQAIWTTDAPKEVERKIRKYAFSGGKDTVEEHRKLGGNPDIDVSFQWLSMLFEPDDHKLASIHDDYKSGKLLSGELKQILIDKINAFLAEHQKRRLDAEKVVDSVIAQHF
ncbi:tryptophan--tRNA ligase [Candidatus Woesearchaeota archaeon]|nr:tryptophan--tRNA ligase [Candidatus Woesearchaeota archaeon]